MKEKEKIVIRKGEGNALTVIDAEEDFMNEETGALYVGGVEGEPSMQDSIKEIKRILSLPFDHTAASKDSHPDGHIEFSLFGKHCPMGEIGERFYGDLEEILKTDEVELIIKGMDIAVFSYSIMTSHMFPRHIAALRAKGIKKIFLVGFALNYCLIESAVAYAIQGFEVYIVRGATRSVPPPYGDQMEVVEMKAKAYKIKFIDADQLVAA